MIEDLLKSKTVRYTALAIALAASGCATTTQKAAVATGAEYAVDPPYFKKSTQVLERTGDHLGRETANFAGQAYKKTRSITTGPFKAAGTFFQKVFGTYKPKGDTPVTNRF